MTQRRMQSSKFKHLVAGTLCWIFAFCILHFELRAVAQGSAYGLGRPLAGAEIRNYDKFITPSGANLPPGSGTAEQGKAVYAAQCARCHGATGREGPEDVLVGGIGSLPTSRPEKTVGSFWPYATTLWDYVNRAMPFDRPGMLPPDDVYAVTAYVLQLNGIVSASDVIDATTLPKIRMPNRDGFIPDARPDTGKPRRASRHP
jgi:mono/diheme cytochrome c family protein